VDGRKTKKACAVEKQMDIWWHTAFSKYVKAEV